MRLGVGAEGRVFLVNESFVPEVGASWHYILLLHLSQKFTFIRSIHYKLHPKMLTDSLMLQICVNRLEHWQHWYKAKTNQLF